MSAMRSKQSLRADLRHARAMRSREDLAAAEPALARTVLGLPAITDANVVAVYLSAGDEPPTFALARDLRARGTTVLAPVMADGRTLDWAEYTGPDGLREAAFGISEPSGPRLGANALTRADAIVLPALAVSRDGRRLGRGAGYYDRALAHAAPSAVRIALVFDDELVADVPTEPHDQPVHVVVTPERVWDCVAY